MVFPQKIRCLILLSFKLRSNSPETKALQVVLSIIMSVSLGDNSDIISQPSSPFIAVCGKDELSDFDSAVLGTRPCRVYMIRKPLLRATDNTRCIGSIGS